MAKLLIPSPLYKILVANRGEIALRVRRAAQSLGIPTAAVYSGQEADSTWVRQFNEAYSLGEGPLSATYLNIESIISLAKKAGADALHPGYGFLSENYRFAKACEDNHIRFIGPSSKILKLMGDKLAANDFVERLGIPVTDKIVDSPLEIGRNGHKLEYPVLVKAAAGGGGKGMRIVRSPEELAGVLEVTASEAYQYFADDRVYVEKYLLAPRHIEVQILGDAQGHIVHLYERECSIQRRHQKILEEAPASCLSDSLRTRIVEAALTIARAVQYVSAGTIEFLLDGRGDFYFLEMNPRIQVEHGITEMITGIDLVKEQIRIAEGYPLTFSQSDIVRKGHAVEGRIYAEDPENDLLPSPGRIHYFREPMMENIRIESAISSGSVIHADFDPLIAKVIAHGPNRKTALLHLDTALDNLIITGVRHNVPLIRAILRNEDFRRNAVSTNFLQDKSELFIENIRLRKENTAIPGLAIAAVLISLKSEQGIRQDSVWYSFGNWRIVPRMSFGYRGRRIEIYYQHTGSDTMDIWIDRQKHSLSQIQIDEKIAAFTSGNVPSHYYYVPETNGTIVLALGDLNFELERFDRLSPVDYDMLLEEETAGEDILLSPLPGKISRLFVALHEKVTRGDKLMIIESMKLENTILAPFTGTVKQINISEGEQVKRNDILLYLKPE
jgi:3-methylcrotonyl-CoA carboxylase alpha subunit